MPDIVICQNKDLTWTLHEGASADQPTCTAELVEDFDFQIPYHYHCTRDEYMTVTRGYVDLTVAGKTTRLFPEMGEFHIPAGQRHGIHKPKGITSTLRERASHPQARIEFFKDLFYGGVMPNPIRAMSVFYREGDTIPAIGDWTPNFVGIVIRWILGGFLGTFLGFTPAPKPKVA